MAKRSKGNTRRSVGKAKIARKTGVRPSRKRPAKRPTRPRPKRAIRGTKATKGTKTQHKAIAPRRTAKVTKPAPRQKATLPAPRATDRARVHSDRLDRVRRTLDETVQMPPSSLDMNCQGSAVRTGRAEMAESRVNHKTMTPAITGGDVDANIENAYFSGDEAPGGDNPTPDQDIVDDIGKALGVEYQDSEELRASDKVVERDKHRWELDSASSEDYKERK